MSQTPNFLCATRLTASAATHTTTLPDDKGSIRARKPAEHVGGTAGGGNFVQGIVSIVSITPRVRGRDRRKKERPTTTSRRSEERKNGRTRKPTHVAVLLLLLLVIIIMSTAPAFALGCALGLYLVNSTRIALWRKDDWIRHEYFGDHTTERAGDASLRTAAERHLFFGPAIRRWAVTQWNVGVVDAVAKPLISHLADKGW